MQDDGFDDDDDLIVAEEADIKYNPIQVDNVDD